MFTTQKLQKYSAEININLFVCVHTQCERTPPRSSHFIQFVKARIFLFLNFYCTYVDLFSSCKYTCCCCICCSSYLKYIYSNLSIRIIRTWYSNMSRYIYFPNLNPTQWIFLSTFCKFNSIIFVDNGEFKGNNCFWTELTTCHAPFNSYSRSWLTNVSFWHCVPTFHFDKRWRIGPNHVQWL